LKYRVIVVGGAVEMDVTFSDGNKYTANVIANDPSIERAIIGVMYMYSNNRCT
jgi:S1-C subfamily serine protease